MTKLQHIRATLAFLQRTPIEGQEAETMVMCKGWLRTMEQLTIEREKLPLTGGTSETPASQVADSSGK